MMRNAERKAFDTLGLEVDATAAEIKARFKELVKRHHPDANGGDRSTEDRLREIIQAYNYLKSVEILLTSGLTTVAPGRQRSAGPQPSG